MKHALYSFALLLLCTSARAQTTSYEDVMLFRQEARNRLINRPDSVLAKLMYHDRVSERSSSFEVRHRGYLEIYDVPLRAVLLILVDPAVWRSVEGTPGPGLRMPPAPAPLSLGWRVTVPPSLERVRLSGVVSVPPGHGLTYGEVLQRAIERLLNGEIRQGEGEISLHPFVR